MEALKSKKFGMIGDLEERTTRKRSKVNYKPSDKITSVTAEDLGVSEDEFAFINEDEDSENSSSEADSE
jgi:hypothetical protein